MTYLTDGFFSTNGEFLLVDRFSFWLRDSVYSVTIDKEKKSGV